MLLHLCVLWSNEAQRFAQVERNATYDMLPQHEAAKTSTVAKMVAMMNQAVKDLSWEYGSGPYAFQCDWETQECIFYYA